MRIGIDLGGTKIEVIALDSDGGELFRKRVPTPRHDYRQTLEAIKGLVLDAEAATVAIVVALATAKTSQGDRQPRPYQA